MMQSMHRWPMLSVHFLSEKLYESMKAGPLCWRKLLFSFFGEFGIIIAKERLEEDGHEKEDR